LGWREKYSDLGTGTVPNSHVFRSLDINRKHCEHCVLIGADYLVQGPEKVIPSLVWLEPSKQRDDFRRKIFAVSVGTCLEGIHHMNTVSGQLKELVSRRAIS